MFSIIIIIVSNKYFANIMIPKKNQVIQYYIATTVGINNQMCVN